MRRVRGPLLSPQLTALAPPVIAALTSCLHSFSAQPAPHFLLTPRADGKVEAVPIGPLFAFRPDPKERRALSLEDAEKLMKSRRAVSGATVMPARQRDLQSKLRR